MLSILRITCFVNKEWCVHRRIGILNVFEVVIYLLDKRMNFNLGSANK